MVFFYDFFQNFLCWFYFFNIELVENYNYNKAKIMWEKHYSFPNKTLGLLQYLPTRFFFSYDFFKIVFVDFIFLILSWLRITITSKTKSCGEALYLSSQNTVYCYSVSNKVFFFSFFLCFFVMIFFKIISVDFIFLILGWLRF
jgi:hypothetical protein